MPINFKKWIAALFITVILCVASLVVILKLDEQSRAPENSPSAYQYVDTHEGKYAESFESNDSKGDEKSTSSKVEIAPNDLLPANTFVTIVDSSDVDDDFVTFDPSDSSLTKNDFAKLSFEDHIDDLDFAEPIDETFEAPVESTSEEEWSASATSGVSFDEIEVADNIEAIDSVDESVAVTDIADDLIAVDENVVVEENVLDVETENEDVVADEDATSELVADTAPVADDSSDDSSDDSIDAAAASVAEEENVAVVSHIAPGFVWGTKDSVDPNGVVLFSEEGVDLDEYQPKKYSEPATLQNNDEAGDDLALANESEAIEAGAIEFDANEVADEETPVVDADSDVDETVEALTSVEAEGEAGEIEFDANEVADEETPVVDADSDVDETVEAPISDEAEGEADVIEFDANEVADEETPAVDADTDVDETVEAPISVEAEGEAGEIEFDANEVADEETPAVDADSDVDETVEALTSAEAEGEADVIEFDANEVIEEEVGADVQAGDSEEEIVFDSNEVVEEGDVEDESDEFEADDVDVEGEAEEIDVETDAEAENEIEFDSNEIVEEESDDVELEENLLTEETVVTEETFEEETTETSIIEEESEIEFDSNDVIEEDVEEKLFENEEENNDELIESTILPDDLSSDLPVDLPADEATDDVDVELEREILFDSNDVNDYEDAAIEYEEVENDESEGDDDLNKASVDNIYSDAIDSDAIEFEENANQEGEEQEQNIEAKSEAGIETESETNANENDSIEENNAELEESVANISCAVLYDSNVQQSQAKSQENANDNSSENQNASESEENNNEESVDVALEAAKQVLYDSNNNSVESTDANANAALNPESKASDENVEMEIDAMEEAGVEMETEDDLDAESADASNGVIKSVSYVVFTDEGVARSAQAQSWNGEYQGREPATFSNTNGNEARVTIVPVEIAPKKENDAASTTLWETDVGWTEPEVRNELEDEFWIVQPSGGSRICWRWTNGTWLRTSESEFFQTDDPERATIFWAHGYKTNMTSATNGGYALKMLVDSWRRSYGVDRKARVVVWKWASEQTGARIAVDAHEKKELAFYYGAELGKFAGRLNPMDDVAFIGFSFGARVVGSALQTMATTNCNYLKPAKDATGFAKSGQDATETTVSQRTHGRITLTLVSAACDWNSFYNNGEFGRGAQLPSVVISLYNPYDEALKLYPLISNGASALGVAPMSSQSFSGTNRNVHNIDMSGALHKRHSFEQALRAAPVSQMIQNVL